MTIRGLGDRWLAGGAVPGVAFAHSQVVEILTGSRAQERGTIALLLGLEPEPIYLVALGDGRGDVRVRQSGLRALA
ncbi:MAG TPA: hypothetical protein VFI52_10025 [Gemmatimonadaceae bacterium]|nr:hypothetical protein [Gemmatimonadaceae bacterium]